MSRAKVAVEKTRDEVGKRKRERIEVENLRKTTAAQQARRSSRRKAHRQRRREMGPLLPCLRRGQTRGIYMRIREEIQDKYFYAKV